MAETYQDRTKVHILTDQFKIIGEIAMFADTRLTDYMLSAHDFIAVTGAAVHDFENNPLFNADFLNVKKDKIVIIVPAAMVKPT